MTAEQLLAYLEEIHEVNLRCVEMISPEQLDFRPAPEVMSVRELLYHMYVNQKFYVQTTISDMMDVNEYKQWMQLTPPDKRALLSFMRGVFSETQALLSDLQDPSKTITTLAGPRTLFHLFVGELEHQLHHRGQLYTYIRLLGLQPPDSGNFMGLSF